MRNLRAIIIDDEPESLRAVHQQVKLFCPNVDVLTTCDNPISGIEAIALHQPDLVFLDIEMPGMTGLEMLSRIRVINFGVIFITAYNKYAVDAFRLSALDYLLKPLDADLLIEAVRKATEKMNKEKTFERYELMVEMMEESRNTGQSRQEQRIALPTFDSIRYESLKNIVRIEAHQNYCKFFFTDGTHLLISKNIGYYEESLKTFDFMRTHRSHIVNLRCVHEYVRQDGGYAKLTDSSRIEVSRNKKDAFLKRLVAL